MRLPIAVVLLASTFVAAQPIRKSPEPLSAHSNVPPRNHRCMESEARASHDVIEYPDSAKYGWNLTRTCEDGIMFADDVSSRERVIAKRRLTRRAIVPSSSWDTGCSLLAPPQESLSTMSVSVGQATFCGKQWFLSREVDPCTYELVGPTYPTEEEACRQ